MIVYRIMGPASGSSAWKCTMAMPVGRWQPQIKTAPASASQGHGAVDVNLSQAGMAGYGRAARACLCTSATIALYGVITAVTKDMT